MAKLSMFDLREIGNILPPSSWPMPNQLEDSFEGGYFENQATEEGLLVFFSVSF